VLGDQVKSANQVELTLSERVKERFGVLPNFFRLAPETPEITEKLWGFAQAAYLDNPLPSVFKERLFVYLSRFCAVRYCIARHVGFLVGLGRPAGNANVSPQRVSDVVRLLRRPLRRREQLQARLVVCGSQPAPISEMPAADAELEQDIFTLAGHVFLQTPEAPACLDALERLLGAVRLQYFLLFLAFVRAAHYWTKVHPEIAFEDDVKELLAVHEALAECIVNDPEASSGGISQSILDELPLLRAKADKAIGLLAAIVDSSEDAIISTDLGGIITSWNAAAQRLFGYRPEEALEQHISLLIPAERHNHDAGIMESVRRGQQADSYDTVRVRKDGSSLDVSLRISPIRDASCNVIGTSTIARDNTQRKRMEQALHESETSYRMLADALEVKVHSRTQELERRNAEVIQQTEQLRNLSRRLLQYQDEERRAIARELHDSAGQTLTVLVLSLAKIAQSAKQDPALLQENIRDARRLVDELTQEIRTTSYLLHPPLLDENGLSSALAWYAQGFAERTGIKIELQISEDFGRLPSELELVVFRLIQECLTNIHRHAGCTSALIQLGRRENSLHLLIRDDGKGMTVEKLTEIQSGGSGVGIRGMRERLRHFHGELTIESSSSGTSVSAELPLSARSPVAKVAAHQRADD
jgi:PAS domain S-box-containing protein